MDTRMLIGQPIIALLSTEAKYKGVTIVACEVVWLQ
jgi:hypothetical protein